MPEAATAADMEAKAVTSDGGVKKKVLVEGDGDPVGVSAKVSFRYSLRLEGKQETFDSSEKRPDGLLSFRLGKRKAIRGLEILLASMCVGERCVGTLSARYAYGSKGLPRRNVPSNSRIEAEVELVSAEQVEQKKGILEMTSRERLDEALVRKRRGNDMFNEAKLEKAVAEYRTCLKYIEYVFYRAGRKDESSNTTQADATPVSKDSDNATSAGSDDSTESAESPSAPVPSNAQESSVVADAEAEPGTDEGFVEAQVEDAEDQQEEASKAAAPIASSNSADDDSKQVSGSESHAAEPAGNTEEACEADPEESEVRQVHVATLNNLSLCLLKLGENKEAERLCTLASNMDPENHKPLYYRCVFASHFMRKTPNKARSRQPLEPPFT